MDWMELSFMLVSGFEWSFEGLGGSHRNIDSVFYKHTTPSGHGDQLWVSSLS